MSEVYVSLSLYTSHKYRSSGPPFGGLLPSNMMVGLTRRSLLLSGIAAARLFAEGKKGEPFPSDASRYPDPLTEIDVYRLTKPDYSTTMTAYYNRGIARNSGWMLCCCDRTGRSAGVSPGPEERRHEAVDRCAGAGRRVPDAHARQSPVLLLRRPILISRDGFQPEGARVVQGPRGMGSGRGQRGPGRHARDPGRDARREFPPAHGVAGARGGAHGDRSHRSR